MRRIPKNQLALLCKMMTMAAETIRARVMDLIQVTGRAAHPLLVVPAAIRNAVIILLASHFLTEMASICYAIWPKWSNQLVDPFISPWYSYRFELKWHIHYVCGDLCWVGTFYAFAKIAKQYSTYMFITAVIFFCYHVIEIIMYFWNYKTSHYVYWDLLFTSCALIKGMFKPYKPETIAKIKSLF